jgi:hypothetical protein
MGALLPPVEVQAQTAYTTSPSSPAARAPASSCRHAEGTQCERISEKFSHEVFGATMEHGLPLSTDFESLHRWIATLPKHGINPLHDDEFCSARERPLRAKPARGILTPNGAR